MPVFRRTLFRLLLPVAFLLAVPQESQAGCVAEGWLEGLDCFWNSEKCGIPESINEGKATKKACDAMEAACEGGGNSQACAEATAAR